jgi:protein O-mannosyl-transferase
VNVLLHASVAALAWFVLRAVGTAYGTALLGGLMFAVLPIHTEAVANVSGRAELLAALFVLLAWHLHGKKGPGPWFASVAYLAAILSKESAVLAPLVFWVGERMRGDRGKASRYVGYVVAVAMMIALRAEVLGINQGAASAIVLDNPAAAAGALPRIATAFWIQLKYAILCVWPYPLSSDYSMNAIPVARSFADPRALAGLAFVSLAVAAVVWGWRHSRPVALSGLVWLLFFLPSSNLLFPTGTIMAERLAYLPSLGICLLAGHLGASFVARAPEAVKRRRGLTVAAIASIDLLAASAATWRRNPAWKDNLTLATTDVVTQPESAKLQAGAGMFLAGAGRNDEAEAHLRRAIAIYPDYAQMHYNLAVVLLRRGARDEAIEHLQRAILIAPGNPLPGQLLEKLQR